jgi:hypothetical protein
MMAFCPMEELNSRANALLGAALLTAAESDAVALTGRLASPATVVFQWLMAA